MPKLAWISDIHVDRLTKRDYQELKIHLSAIGSDALIISGDIAEGKRVFECLEDYGKAFDFPIYFVLGNHDFYFNSFDVVKEEIRTLVSRLPTLKWLSEAGILPLTSNIALLGIEGWGDGGYAQVPTDGLGIPRDFFNIKDLAALKRNEYAEALSTLGRESAEALRPVLTEAAAEYREILFVTHVPPFPEASLDRSGRICDKAKLPFYACKAIGDLLLSVMAKHADCNMTVLCGHTHEGCEVQILDNLRVRVKDASYGSWWDATVINL